MKHLKTSISSLSFAAIVSCIAGIAVTNVSVADVEAGRLAANRGEYRKAYDEWRPLAEAGNAEAQYNLGRLYANGDGVDRSYPEAFRWFERAGMQGHKKAQKALARMYKFGDGVKKDLVQSERWRTGKAVSVSAAKVISTPVPSEPEKGTSPEIQEQTVAIQVENRVAVVQPSPVQPSLVQPSLVQPSPVANAEPTAVSLIVPPVETPPLTDDDGERKAYLDELVGTSPELQPSPEPSPKKSPASPGFGKALSAFGAWIRPNLGNPSPSPTQSGGNAETGNELGSEDQLPSVGSQAQVPVVTK